MRRTIPIATLAVIVLLAVPASADPVAVAGFYIDDDGDPSDGTVFQETNGLDGLQKVAVAVTGPDGRDYLYPPDDLIA
ncbi:MAG: hypothetical protein KY455_13435 [Euryarchaeota archaeon]|nr:hypothetical protein [Euryarchaeota archaeon]